MEKKIFSLFLSLSILLCGCTPAEKNDNLMEQDTEEIREAWDPGHLWCSNYYLVDLDNGQIILDRGSTEKIYPASMTKMMTAILAIEMIPDPEHTMIPFTEEMLDGLEEAGAARAGFTVGDEPTALDYIYGDMLPSGADCSRALAFWLSGSEEAYVGLMNKKAQELGMVNTHFTNTTGLHDDGHYSTCRDMAILLEYCMQNELFMQVMTTEYYRTEPLKGYRKGLGMDNAVLRYVNQEEPYYLYSFDCPGFIGGKSGYTHEAEYTLASLAEENGRHLLLVNAHGYFKPHYPASIEDATVIYNAFAEDFTYRNVVEKGQSFGTIRVMNSNEPDPEVCAAKSLIADADETGVHYDVHLMDGLNAPIAAGSTVGSVDVYVFDQMVGSVDLVIKQARTKTAAGMIRTFAFEHPYVPVTLLAVLIVLLSFMIFRLMHDRRR